MPKSLRFRVVSMEKPALSLPQGSFPKPRNWTGSVTSLATPWMGSVPGTSYLSLPAALTFELLNVSSGNFSTSKKLALSRSLSRPSFAVSMLAALTENSTLAASGLAGSTVIVPAKSLKWPRTLLIMWRIWKLASECILSIAYVSARTGEAASTAAAAVLDTLRIISSPCFAGRARGRSRGRQRVIPGEVRVGPPAAHRAGGRAAQGVGGAHEGNRGFLGGRGERRALLDLLLHGAAHARHDGNVKS